MTQKMFVSMACMWLMLSVFGCFADDGITKDRPVKFRSGMHCPKCGEVPSSECGLDYCSACKKAPGQIRHIQNCQVLRHKCGHRVTSKRSPAKTTKPVNKAAVTLPADFAISYETKTAGVLPVVTSFMRISKTKEGAFFFVQGQRAWDGEKQNETVVYKYELTNAQCQKVYKSSQDLGFFKLKSNYSADDGMTGGESKEVKVTANGKSKTVSTYEKSQASFDKLVAIIEEHSLINVLKSRQKAK